MQWVVTGDTARLLANSSVAARFLATLPAGALRCEFDGLEFDYEPGTKQTQQQADAYTQLLVAVKVAAGSDVAAWTSIPYITPAKMGPPGAGIDFVNLMSYFFSAAGSMQSYIDGAAKLRAWGFSASRVNLGVPYYDSGQGAWATLAAPCARTLPPPPTCVAMPSSWENT